MIGIVQAVISFNYLDQPGLTDFLLLIAVAGRRLLAEPVGSGRDPDLRLRRQGGADPRAAAQDLVGPPDRPHRPRPHVRRCRRTAPARHPAVPAPAVHHDPRASRSARCRSPSSPAGPASCRSARWPSPASARSSPRRSPAGSTSTSAIGDTRLLKAGLEPLRFGPAVLLACVVTAGRRRAHRRGRAARPWPASWPSSPSPSPWPPAQYIYDRPILSGGFTDSVPLRRTDVFGIDITDPALLLLRRPRRPRRLRGHRRPPPARAASVARPSVCATTPTRRRPTPCRPTRTKLRAFALAGGIAGLGGVAARRQHPVDPERPLLHRFRLAPARVDGGDRRAGLGGRRRARRPVGHRPARRSSPTTTSSRCSRSSIGLLVLLLYFPGGLVQIGYGVRRALFGFDGAAPRAGPGQAAPRHPEAAGRASASRCPPACPRSRPTSIVVRFGGNVAVDEVSIEVGDGEIVGLIGTNGAGKSTLMNAIGGYVPSKGTVDAAGPGHHREVHRRTSPARARAHLPGRHALPRAHRPRDRPRRPRSPRANRHPLHRPLLAPSDHARAGPSVRGRRAHRLPRASAATPMPPSSTSPPAPAASSSSPASSPSTPACSASTSPPPASPSARPRRSGPSSSRSAASWARRCSSSSTTCR